MSASNPKYSEISLENLRLALADDSMWQTVSTHPHLMFLAQAETEVEVENDDEEAVEEEETEDETVDEESNDTPPQNNNEEDLEEDTIEDTQTQNARQQDTESTDEDTQAKKKEKDDEDEDGEECVQERDEDGNVLSDECKPTASGDEDEDDELGEGQGPLIPIGYGNEGDDIDDMDIELAFGSDEDAVVVVFIDEDVIRDFLIAEGDEIPPELQAGEDSYSTFGNTGLDVLGDGNTLPPIVLDLDGDGVELLDASVAKFQFDVDGDKTLDSLGWAGNDDGVLVYDGDQSGTISSIDEFVFSRWDPGANTDTEGLRAAFDTNDDGVLDSQDSKFTDFRVWQDANGDGLVDEGEFLSLSELGITSINLTTDGNTHWQGNNLIHGFGEYTTAKNGTFAFADVGLGLEGGSGNNATTSSRVFTGSVLDNDDTSNNVVVTGVSNVTEGAMVLMNPDGTFTYIPPPGVTGITDTFTYTIQNDLGQTGEGTVSIDISGMIWYIDNSQELTPTDNVIESSLSTQNVNIVGGSAGMGTSYSPFTSFDVFNSLDRPDLAGDWFYIHTGTSPYDGGISLLDNQVILGQGTDLTFNGITLIIGNPEGAPTLTNFGSDNDGSAILLANNNTLEGFDIGYTTGPAIGTSPTGDSTFTDFTVQNSPSTGLAATNLPAGTHTFSNLNILNSGGIGIDITNNLAGTLNFNNVNVDGAVGAGVRLLNNDATVNFDGLSVSNVAANGLPGIGILITQNGGPVNFLSPVTLTDNVLGLEINQSSGSVTFNGLNVVNNTLPGGPGIRIVDNVGGSFTFNGTTSVDNASNAGVFMNNNDGSGITFGTLNVTNTQGLGDGVVGFNNINSTSVNVGTLNALDNSGINVFLDTNTGSFFTFNGLNIGGSSGATSGKGFLAQNSGTVEISGTMNTIHSSGPALSLLETDVGSSGITLMSLNSDGGQGGILLDTVAGPGFVTVTGDSTNAGSGGTIQNSTGPAVITYDVFVPVNLNLMNFANNAAGSLLLTNSNNFAVTNSSFTGTHLPDVNVIDGWWDNGSLGGMQTLTLKNNTFDNILGDQNVIRTSSSNPDTNVHLVLDNNLFQNIQLSDTNTGGSVPVLISEALSGGLMTSDVMGNTFSGSLANGPNHFANHTVFLADGGTHKLGITNNTFQNSDMLGKINNSIEVVGVGGSTFEGAISQNTFANNLNSNGIVVGLPDSLGAVPDTITDLKIQQNNFDNLPNHSAFVAFLADNVTQSQIDFSLNKIGLNNPVIGSPSFASPTIPVISYTAFGPMQSSPATHNLVMLNNDIHALTPFNLVNIGIDAGVNALVDFQGNILDHLGSDAQESFSTFFLETFSPTDLKLNGNTVTLPSLGLGNLHYEILDPNAAVLLDPFGQTGTPQDIISLNNQPTTTFEVFFGPGRVTQPVPVVLDLDGDGVELVSPENSNVVHPTLLVNMGWVGPDDALLVYDKDMSGDYSGLEEIVLTLYHPDAKTDLDGLRLGFDSNNDGVFDTNDNQWSQFAVWQDANQNGVTDEGEWNYLDNTSIARLNLDYELAPSIIDGNIDHGSSTYVLDDGTVADLGNIQFAIQDSLTLSDLLGTCTECTHTANDVTPAPTSTQSDPLADTNPDHFEMGL